MWEANSIEAKEDYGALMPGLELLARKLSKQSRNYYDRNFCHFEF